MQITVVDRGTIICSDSSLLEGVDGTSEQAAGTTTKIRAPIQAHVPLLSPRSPRVLQNPVIVFLLTILVEVVTNQEHGVTRGGAARPAVDVFFVLLELKVGGVQRHVHWLPRHRLHQVQLGVGIYSPEAVDGYDPKNTRGVAGTLHPSAMSTELA
jgi:hypothetical protein